jgi:hypothetical protein
MYGLSSEHTFYGLYIEYLPKTVEIAYEYLLEFTNERAAYEAITRYVHLSKPTTITTSFPYDYEKGRSSYLKFLRQVEQTDKSNFAALCRILIWNHYAEEFELRLFDIQIKQKFSEQLRTEIDNHLNNAEQHLRFVENQMNTLTKYASETTTTVTLIHGKPVEDYKEYERLQLLSKAREAQQDTSHQIYTSKRIEDTTSGFRLYNKKALLLVAENYPDEYPEPQSIIDFHKAGLSVKEVPVLMAERQGGQSSIRNFNQLYYLFKVTIAMFFSFIRNKK